ncbi:MAG: DUF58 domain-containing protein [Acidimicrobiia bacterium]|nr:DUF58 domain-containing protein [Acidimicrobiia bacterium]
MSTLLDPQLLARLERLQLGTRRRLAGGLTGDHRSPRHGTSLDFADYREYSPGDDLRRIDQFAFARLDKLLLKLFEAEDDVTVRILIDTSASMAGDKLHRAKQLAAAVGFVSLTRRDVVTVHTFPSLTPSPRLLGRSAIGQLFSILENLDASGDTPFVSAVTKLLSQPGPPGLTVVLSDLLTIEWEQGVRRLPARRGDLAIIQVLDRSDIYPEIAGDLELVDAESGARVEVSLSSAVVEDYAALATAWIDEVATRVRSTGGGFARVFTDDPLEEVLFSGWRREGVLR